MEQGGGGQLDVVSLTAAIDASARTSNITATELPKSGIGIAAGSLATITVAHCSKSG
jgi:hypothetical protein